MSLEYEPASEPLQLEWLWGEGEVNSPLTISTLTRSVCGTTSSTLGRQLKKYRQLKKWRTSLRIDEHEWREQGLSCGRTRTSTRLRPCRANAAQISQSGPDFGLGLSHFRGQKSLTPLIDSGLVCSTEYHESRRCSRETYPESYTTKYTSIRRLFSSRSAAAWLWGEGEVDSPPPTDCFSLSSYTIFLRILLRPRPESGLDCPLSCVCRIRSTADY